MTKSLPVLTIFQNFGILRWRSFSCSLKADNRRAQKLFAVRASLPKNAWETKAPLALRSLYSKIQESLDKHALAIHNIQMVPSPLDTSALSHAICEGMVDVLILGPHCNGKSDVTELGVALRSNRRTKSLIIMGKGDIGIISRVQCFDLFTVLEIVFMFPPLHIFLYGFR